MPRMTVAEFHERLQEARASRIADSEILDALQEAGGIVADAAYQLGISIDTFRRRIATIPIPMDRKPSAELVAKHARKKFKQADRRARELKQTRPADMHANRRAVDSVWWLPRFEVLEFQAKPESADGERVYLAVIKTNQDMNRGDFEKCLSLGTIQNHVKKGHKLSDIPFGTVPDGLPVEGNKITTSRIVVPGNRTSEREVFKHPRM
jgi:hypothetical protein